MQPRRATRSDRGAVHGVHWAAFAESERALVARLAVRLLSERTTPPTISLVAEVDGVVAGHVAFSPVTIESAGDTQDLHGYILAPLAVRPELQKRRIGTRLVETGISELSGAGVDVVFVYGDPEYYGRFGFSARAAEGYIPPYELEYPSGWQGLVLGACATRESPAAITCVPALSDPALW